MIKTLEVGQMRSNCYLFWKDPENAIIIDPGDDADYIIQNIRELELTPSAVIATHGHFDHIMAALELKLAYKIPFYIHEKDEFLLTRMEKSAKLFVGFDPGPAPEADIYLKNDSILEIPASAGRGNCQLKIIPAPGHTPGSVCLYDKPNLFVGDLLFADGATGRADFVYSDKEKLKKSIKKISRLPKETIIYPGHGESFILKNYFTHQ